MSTPIPVTLTPQSLPANTCYPSEQARLVDFVAHTNATLPINFTTVIVSQTAPGPDDRDKVWVAVDGNNQILGIYTFANGLWSMIAPAAPYIVKGEFRMYDPGLYTPIAPWFPCDGSVTGVPDLRGRVPIGTGQRTLPAGSTDTATNFVANAQGGRETLALTAQNIPAHAHTLVGIGYQPSVVGTSSSQAIPETGAARDTGLPGYVSGGNTTGFAADGVTPNPPTPAPALPPYFAAAYMQWRPDLA